MLDHAFEMMLKAAILHRGGRIREKRAKETIGFDACVRRALSDSKIKFLGDEQALLLQTINGLRNAAQHHLLEVSEGQLYMHAQAGVTLFRDLLLSVLGKNLRDSLPSRVLPVSTSPPTSFATLFESEVGEIRKLLGPGRRRRVEAEARLRPLAILDATISGEKGQPSTGDLRRVGQRLLDGTNWQVVPRRWRSQRKGLDRAYRCVYRKRKAFRFNLFQRAHQAPLLLLSSGWMSLATTAWEQPG